MELIPPSIAYSYSGLAADTLRDLVTTLTFDLLILVSGHTLRGGVDDLGQWSYMTTDQDRQPLHEV